MRDHELDLSTTAVMAARRMKGDMQHERDTQARGSAQPHHASSATIAEHYTWHTICERYGIYERRTHSHSAHASNSGLTASVPRPVMLACAACRRTRADHRLSVSNGEA